ncbi:MAG: hypothetical protein P9L92_10180 [Candidatus Electryonea clarkiae]|nr:hypothetical protein [Candidatus Electryonea clarkiae]
MEIDPRLENLQNLIENKRSRMMRNEVRQNNVNQRFPIVPLNKPDQGLTVSRNSNRVSSSYNQGTKINENSEIFQVKKTINRREGLSPPINDSKLNMGESEFRMSRGDGHLGQSLDIYA